MDPAKVKAIREWEKPTSVKGVRSFLGFANFYRRFIKDFSNICSPLTDLTGKGTAQQKPFSLTAAAEKAFEELKGIFITAPVLAQFDPDRETVLECDASGWAVGATLMQYDDEKLLRPTAYFSKKLNAAQCNYEIHDKEMLAIIEALREWRAELKSVGPFRILTDHKNLQYFRTTKHLNERQARWSLVLSEFDYHLEYRPGKLGVMPDALSRREQDIPIDKNDDRIKSRFLQLVKGDDLQVSRLTVLEDTDVQQLWDDTVRSDGMYQKLLEAVRQGDRMLPEDYRSLRIAMSDLSSPEEGVLRYRGRRWVPESEPLRTKLMQSLHDSALTGHPGKEGLAAILRREYHWPYMTQDIRTFVKNCHSCGRNKTWRNRTQGLLMPLPVPDRIWTEISMDYITEMPTTSKGKRHILVIVDRLSKGAFFISCKDLRSETLARKFIKYYLPHHLIPTAITSDRGEQFVDGIWKYICESLKINQRLSTAFHPQTDGSTERMNQTLEEYLRHFCNYYQTDWDELLPLAQAAISVRNAASTSASPFFLSHGYNPNIPHGLNVERVHAPANAPQRSALNIIKTIKDATDLAETMMGHAQQLQEDIANRTRDPAPTFQPGDKVWLDLRNIKLDRPKRKIAEQHAIYTVQERINANAYRLNTPTGIHNVFPVSLLKPVSVNPFPSQIQDDTQPSLSTEEQPILEEIVDHRVVRGRGRGGPMKHQYLCYYTGHAAPLWKDHRQLVGTPQFDAYEVSEGRREGG